jgi:non-specific serine/threonine protein kinase/serine/threonine-protein kinase
VSDARWERLKAIFDQALDLPAERRAAFLDEACGPDRALRDEAQALLASHEAAGGFLEAPAVAQIGLSSIPKEPAAAGARVGPYVILGELGRGGMGTVYHARRDEDRKEVALKVVHGGLSASLFAARFRQERRILARLEHPGIARLIDGGSTDDGRLYYAMEYVDGRPLDAYVADTQPNLRARLELFRAICAAVAFAHRNLVVHRDLKPGNIVVARDGTPRLLDFGIAKLLAPDDTDAPELTLTGMQLMTPEYASPEQVRGEAVTTATDAYALGLILYLLLAGRRAFEFPTRSAEEVTRVVCQQEPRPPSEAGGRLTARERRALVGDLDTIVLKALRKEPSRRYATADELSEDVRRYLEGLPVLARRDTVRYRATKFVRRHRGAVAASVLLVLSLVAGLAATLHQARLAGQARARAEQRSRDAQRLANSLVFELHDAIADLPGATATRALLVKRASEMLDTLSAEMPDDPVLAESLAAAYHRLGIVLGTPGDANLGDSAGALAAHRKGLALRERAAAQVPGDLDRQESLATSHVDLSYALGSGSEAVAQARAAVELSARLVAAKPEEPRYARRLAHAQFALGSALVVGGDAPGAARSFAEAARVYETMLGREPDNEALLRNAAIARKRLGAIEAKAERYAEAIGHYRSALALDERRLAKSPESVRTRYDVSVSLVDLGMTLGNSGDWVGQLEHAERALAIREELLRADPRNELARTGVVSVLLRTARAQRRLGRPRDSLVQLGRAESLLKPPPADAALRADVARTASEALADLGRWTDAVRRARVATGARDAAVARQPGDAWLRTSRVSDHLALAHALEGLAASADGGSPDVTDRWREAADSYRRALQLATELAQAGLLLGDDARLPQRAQGGLARCERALVPSASSR